MQTSWLNENHYWKIQIEKFNWIGNKYYNALRTLDAQSCFWEMLPYVTKPRTSRKSDGGCKSDSVKSQQVTRCSNELSAMLRDPAISRLRMQASLTTGFNWRRLAALVSCCDDLRCSAGGRGRFVLRRRYYLFVLYFYSNVIVINTKKNIQDCPHVI